MLSEETEAIVQRLISAGYHRTRGEVVNAALAAYQDAMEGNAIGFHADQI
jgi:Arc/MetJ-type ribon-helix-helix transcriptional regulator